MDEPSILTRTPPGPCGRRPPSHGRARRPARPSPWRCRASTCGARGAPARTAPPRTRRRAAWGWTGPPGPGGRPASSRSSRMSESNAPSEISGASLASVQIAVMLYLAPQLLDARLGIAGRARERALVQQRLLFVRHVCHRRRFLPKGTRAPATQEPSCFLGNSTTSLRKAASSTHLSPLHRTECRSRLLSRQHPRGALPAHRPCARHFAARATP